MAKVKPFQAVRPTKEYVSKVAALPYDVYNRQEVKEEVLSEPDSFLKIDRAETQFPDDVDTYDACVYEKAREIYQDMKQSGIYREDSEECYYLYELTMDGRAQTGIVACASVDDYMNGVIKKHENTRAEKEQDRIHHVDTMSAQTGPIFLAYRSNDDLNAIVAQVKEEEALYDFTAKDGIGHKVWKIAVPDMVAKIEKIFANIGEIYIADGHHRAASAVKVSLKRRKEHPDYNGTEEFNFFLSVLFPDTELLIMDYNRSVKDLNGLSKEAFIEKIKEHFSVTELPERKHPAKKGQITMYLEKKWYLLEAGEELLKISDLYVATSKREGLPVNILEAIVAGLPLVVTNSRGQRELVEDGKNGYVVNIGDVDSLVEKIQNIYLDNRMRSIIVKNASNTKLSKIITSNNNLKQVKSEMIINIKAKNKKLRNKNLKEEKIIFSGENELNTKKNMKETEENNQNEIYETSFDKRKINFTDSELDDMSYELAIIYDKRTFTVNISIHF